MSTQISFANPKIKMKILNGEFKIQDSKFKIENRQLKNEIQN